LERSDRYQRGCNSEYNVQLRSKICCLVDRRSYAKMDMESTRKPGKPDDVEGTG
jgi:hypothetical protein